MPAITRLPAHLLCAACPLLVPRKLAQAKRSSRWQVAWGGQVEAFSLDGSSLDTLLAGSQVTGWVDPLGGV